MTTQLYTRDERGISFSSERRAGDVRISNYVYDLWMPLLGVDVIGIYAVYCRLERSGVTKSLSLSVLATACRIGKRTLLEVNKTLAKYGFIRIVKPTGVNRLKHFTTEIVVLDPPREISADVISELKPKGGYRTLAEWLVGPEVPNETTGSAVENRQDCNPGGCSGTHKRSGHASRAGNASNSTPVTDTEWEREWANYRPSEFPDDPIFGYVATHVQRVTPEQAWNDPDLKKQADIRMNYVVNKEKETRALIDGVPRERPLSREDRSEIAGRMHLGLVAFHREIHSHRLRLPVSDKDWAELIDRWYDVGCPVPDDGDGRYTLKADCELCDGRGWISYVDENGAEKTARCACWVDLWKDDDAE